jgi:hypothetical protein
MTIALHRDEGGLGFSRAAGIGLLIPCSKERFSRQRSRRYVLVDGLPTGEWFILRPSNSRLDEQLVDAACPKISHLA